MAATFPTFEQLLRPEKQAELVSLQQEIFENPDAVGEQSGKFKIEGVFDFGMFRMSKAYYLDGEEKVVRLRGIPRRFHKLLDKSKFEPDPSVNRAVVRGVKLRPTLGMNMVLVCESRSVSHALNMKRKMIVSIFSL